MRQQIKSNGKTSKSKLSINNKTQRASDETEIRRQIDHLVKALCNMELEKVMSIYAQNIVSFDVEGTYLGAKEKKNAWAKIFSMLEPPLNYQIRDFDISIADLKLEISIIF